MPKRAEKLRLELYRRLRLAVAAVLAVLIGAVCVAAQTVPSNASALVESESKPATVEVKPVEAPASKPAPAPPKPTRFHGVTFSGSVRVRLNNYGWFDTPNYEDEYTFGEATLRLSAGQQREKFDWLVEGEFPLLVNLPDQAIAPAPQGQLGIGASYFAANGRRDGSAILKQGYVRLKGVFGDAPSRLRVGRFEFIDGMETVPGDATLATIKRDQIAHRLIGNFGFTAVGRSFDAVEFVRNTKRGNFTFMGGRPTEGVFQLRGLNELNVDVWYGAFTKTITSKKVASEFRLLALHYHDGRGTLKTDNRPLVLRQADHANIRLTTVGGNYLAAVKTTHGTIDLLAWGVGQFGSWGNQDHRAGALVFEGGFQPQGKLAQWKTWLRGGYSRTTGDGDPADGRHTTFFQVLPTPRWYARFPFYNMMNLQDVYAQLRLKPSSRISLRAEIHSLTLSNKRDLWYSGGGAFQEGTFGYTGRATGGTRGLGKMFDLSADLNLTPTTTLTVYAAGVRGGSVQSVIYPTGGPNPTARLVYAEVVKRF